MGARYIATMNDIASMPLEDVVSRAWALRSQFDLTNVGYGQIHWGNFRDVLADAPSYYYFLAGLVRLSGAEKILEIGTHQGGSTRAMCKGLISPPASRIVTFDVTAYGAEMFVRDPVVHAYTMDANTEVALDTCVREFGGSAIDLAFIDSTHDFWTTMQSVALYTAGFKCPLLVIDDITLNPSMVRLWSLLRARHGDNAIDASEVHYEIRPGGPETRPGFGVVRIPQ